MARDRAFLVRVARQLVRDASDVDDIVQDAFVAALSKGRVNGRTDRAYARGIVRNLARRRWRDQDRRLRRETRAAQSDRLPDSALQVSASETRDVLAEQVDSLPETYRVPLLLCYYDGLTPTEIAARLGLTPSTVRTRLQRARERLRTRLDRRFGSGREALGVVLLPLAADPTVPVSAAGAEVASATTTAVLGGALVTLFQSLATRTAAAVLVCAAGLSLALDPIYDGVFGTQAASSRLVATATGTVSDDERSGMDVLGQRTGATPDSALDLHQGFRSTGPAEPGAAGAQASDLAQSVPLRGLRGHVQRLGAVTDDIRIAAFRMGPDGPDSVAAAATKADVTGAFTLRVPADEAFLIVALSRGYVPVTAFLPATSDAPLRLNLSRGAGFSGRLAGGHLAAGRLLARVHPATPAARMLNVGDGTLAELDWSDGRVHWNEIAVETLPDGAIQVAGLHPGRFVLDLVQGTAADGQPTAPGQVMGRIEVTVEPPAPDEIPATDAPVAPDAFSGSEQIAERGTDADAGIQHEAPQAESDPLGSRPFDTDTESEPFSRGTPVWEWQPDTSSDARVVTRQGPDPFDLGNFGVGDVEVLEAAVPQGPPVALLPDPSPTPLPPQALPGVPLPATPIPGVPLPGVPGPIDPGQGVPPGGTPAPTTGPVTPGPINPGPLTPGQPQDGILSDTGFVDLLAQGKGALQLIPVNPDVPPCHYLIERVLDPALAGLAALKSERVSVDPGDGLIILPAGRYVIWPADLGVLAQIGAVWVDLGAGQAVVVAVGAPR